MDKIRSRLLLSIGLTSGAVSLVLAFGSVSFAAEPFKGEQNKPITSPAMCRSLNLEYEAQHNLCLKKEGMLPPQHSASSPQSPQERCHNACSAGANNAGGTLWFSGIDENGVCVCGICDLRIPGIGRFTNYSFCNVFSLGRHP
jgi:hypothetical protein